MQPLPPVSSPRRPRPEVIRRSLDRPGHHPWARAAAVLVMVSALCAGAAPAQAAPAAGLPAPGRYKDWHNHVDDLEVLQPFRLGDYQRVVVAALDSRGLALPTDETLAPTRAALAGASGPFVQGLQKHLPRDARLAVEQGGETATGKGGAATLLVRGRFTRFNPGSRAARYFGGFGAGAAEVAIAGEVVDARSGRVLLRFVQQRRSAFGAFGGGYVELLNRSLNEIGGDVGSVLADAR